MTRPSETVPQTVVVKKFAAESWFYQIFFSYNLSASLGKCIVALKNIPTGNSQMISVLETAVG